MTMTASTDLTVKTCPTCGIVYAAPEHFFNSRNENGGNTGWYCPNGHHLVFKESEADRLKRVLNTKNRRIENLEGERDYLQKSVRTYKGHLTRTKNRVGKGVCPCCNRYFKQLHRHMKNQHPDYIEQLESESA